MIMPKNTNKKKRRTRTNFDLTADSLIEKILNYSNEV